MENPARMGPMIKISHLSDTWERNDGGTTTRQIRLKADLMFESNR